MGEATADAVGSCAGGRASASVPDKIRDLPFMTQEHFDEYRVELARKGVLIERNKNGYPITLE